MARCVHIMKNMNKFCWQLRRQDIIWAKSTSRCNFFYYGKTWSGKKYSSSNVKFFCHLLTLRQCLLWQYALSSFQEGDTKLERFLPKNQHTERKLLNFENWINGKVSKSAKIWLSKFFIEEYPFRSTFFVIDIFW